MIKPLSLSLLLLIPALSIAQQTIYRWTDPETGRFVTTPTPPPYPMLEKRPGANLPGVEFFNVDLDPKAPAFKAAVSKREAQQAEERRQDQERAERQAQQERAKQIEEEKEQRQSAQRNFEHQVLKARCTGPLSFGIRLGMDAEQVRACMDQINPNGYPDRVNTTTTGAGLREQWVYKMSSGNWYFYFSNGALTAIQQ